MKPILRCALAAVVLSGCGVGSGAMPAKPASAPLPAMQPQARVGADPQARSSVVGDPVITPVAVTAPAPASAPAAQPALAAPPADEPAPPGP